MTHDFRIKMQPTLLLPPAAYRQTFVLSVEPMVALANGLLDQDGCEHIIRLAKGHIADAVATLGPAASPSPASSGTSCWLRDDSDDIVRSLVQRLADLLAFPLEHAEGVQVVHYRPGQRESSHYDAYDLRTSIGQRACRCGHQRVATVLLYLNDVAEGGVTHFPELALEVLPTRGQGVLFNTVGTSPFKPHPGSLRGERPVIRGEKWLCTLWFRARPLHEVQDFSEVPAIRGASASTRDAPAMPAAPNRDRSAAPRLILRVNRASRLFEQALRRVRAAGRLPREDVCFSYWDSYAGNHLDRSEFPPQLRLIRLLDRRRSNPLADKARLAALLEEHGAAAWAPATFASVAAARQHNPDPHALWFIKPTLLSGGREMYCLRGSDLPGHSLGRNCIVQAAITNLELDRGRKFTVRVYLLIWQQTVYLYQEGFMLTHGVPYREDSTDYAVHIDHRGYERPTSQVQMAPLSCYPKQAQYRPRITALVEALKPVMGECIAASSGDEYLLLGIDLLYQQDGQVQLVEINTAPNFVHSREVNEQVNIPFFAAVMTALLNPTDRLPPDLMPI